MAEITRAPTSDAASSGTWTPSAGSTVYTCVDDYPTTSGDYVTSVTNNGYIEFGFTALDVPANSTGIVVYVDYYDQDDTSGTNSICSRLRNASTSYNYSASGGATHDPGASYALTTDTWTNDPATGAAWTVAGVNALTRFGFVNPDCNPDIRIACCQLRVYYVPSGVALTEHSAEVVGIADGRVSRRGLSRPANELVGLKDASRWPRSLGRVCSELLGLGDSRQAARVLGRAYSELLGLGDQRQAARVLGRVCSELLGLGDSAGRALGISRVIASLLGLVERLRKIAPLRLTAVRHETHVDLDWE